MYKQQFIFLYQRKGTLNQKEFDKFINVISINSIFVFECLMLSDKLIKQ